ncbi:MAG: phosphoadenylyl-sulfate reductase [Alphaproteobacteria bacterium]
MVTETNFAAWPEGAQDDLVQTLTDAYLETQASEDIDLAALLADPRLGRFALLSSFGAESVVMIHLVTSLVRDTPVLFLDTGQHFPETLDYVKHVKDALNLNLHSIKPNAELTLSEDPEKTLHKVNPNQCCMLRKSLPLGDALQGYDSWFTGRKRFHGGLRSFMPVIERDGQHLKINPLARWSKKRVEQYFYEHELPRHPLERFGFASIGCAPCTAPIEAGQGLRDGRWADMPSKFECGIHLGPDGTLIRES